VTLAVLDTSALLAMLLGEAGGELVVPVLAESAMSTVNLAEVVGYYARKGASERDIQLVLGGLPIERIPLDDDLATKTGLLLPLTKSAGLSLGDRACIALARRMGVKVMTADRAWHALGRQLGIDVELIRK
jgi:PIN domain nuclease of toxin-antitoxin system